MKPCFDHKDYGPITRTTCVHCGWMAAASQPTIITLLELKHQCPALQLELSPSQAA